jgi:hypothetical protein
VPISGIQSSRFDLAILYKFKICFGLFPIEISLCIQIFRDPPFSSKFQTGCQFPMTLIQVLLEAAIITVQIHRLKNMHVRYNLYLSTVQGSARSPAVAVKALEVKVLVVLPRRRRGTSVPLFNMSLCYWSGWPFLICEPFPPCRQNDGMHMYMQMLF